MTSQAVTGPRLRGLAPHEPEELGDLLDAAFSGYRDTTRFVAPVLDLLNRWSWDATRLSVGIDTGGGLVAVGLGSLRRARFRGRDLTAVHLGPIGVRPGYRRKGLGGLMLQGLEERARDHGADVLTLTTEVLYGAWRLYGRHGFRIIETYRPIVRPLFPGLSEARRVVQNPDVEAVDAETFAAGFRPGPGRDRAVVEVWTAEPEAARVLRPRHLCAGPAAISTLRWPVLSRTAQGRVQVWATQILRVQGTGGPLNALLTEVSRLAQDERSVCLYALPTAAETLPGFSPRGTPRVHRMVRPLTPLGEQVAQQARAWDEVCPAP